jgi:hypothetical protein
METYRIRATDAKTAKRWVLYWLDVLRDSIQIGERVLEGTRDPAVRRQIERGIVQRVGWYARVERAFVTFGHPGA